MTSLVSMLASGVAFAAASSLISLSVVAPAGWSWTRTGSETLEITQSDGRNVYGAINGQPGGRPELRLDQVPSDATAIRVVLFACRKKDGPKVCRRVPLRWIGPFSAGQKFKLSSF